MNNKDRIIELYKTYWICMINKDIEGLNAIMTDNYVLVHMTGKRQGKNSFFASLRSGELNYYSAEHDDITADIFGETATLIGKSKVVAAVYGGGRNKWRLRGDFYSAKRK